MNIVEKNECHVYPVIVPTPYSVGDVNMYIVEAAGTVSLIDAGIDSDDCWDALNQTLSEIGLTLGDLSQILLTHHHSDHIGLINRISTIRDIPIYAHRESIYRLKRDPEFLSMRIRFFEQLYREMGCGSAGERHIEYLKEASRKNEKFKIHAEIIPLSDSETIGSYQVVYVPGHSPDHIAFWDAKRRWLFAGDHLIQHISSNAFVEPDREGKRIFALAEYANSLKKCLSLEAEIAFSGHGELIRNHKHLIELRLTRMEQKAEKIRSLIQSGISTAYGLAQTYYPSKYLSQFSLVMSEIIGLLDFLEAKNKIQKEQRNGVWHYFS